MFAPENVLCVAAELIDPHDNVPDVSLSNACVVVGRETGRFKLYVEDNVEGVVREIVFRTLLFVR